MYIYTGRYIKIEKLHIFLNIATWHTCLIAKNHAICAKFNDWSCNSMRNYSRKCKNWCFICRTSLQKKIPSISCLTIQICLKASLGSEKKISGLKLWKKSWIVILKICLFKISWLTIKWRRRKIKMSRVKLFMVQPVAAYSHEIWIEKGHNKAILKRFFFRFNTLNTFLYITCVITFLRLKISICQ